MTETEQNHGAVSADSRMADVLARDLNAPVVLMRYHIGGCSMCGFEPDDTVQQVADDNGVPVQVLIEALNA